MPVGDGNLAIRLRARQAEIEDAVLARVLAVSSLSQMTDPEYAEGLRAAVRAAIDYALDTIECGGHRSPPPPLALIVQARLAARTGVSLDTVLRRYVAGQAVIADFVVKEAEAGRRLQRIELKTSLQAMAGIFDRLVAAVSEEHRREAAEALATGKQRRLKQVERLLAGEVFDTSDMTYDFESHQLGLVVRGADATGMLRRLGASLDRGLLLVERGEDTAWAWLAGRQVLDPGEVEEATGTIGASELAIAIGEPAKSLAGWRLTHRQASAALPIALRRSEAVVRYRNVALLAAVLHDDLLKVSLRTMYLEPLEVGRDGGDALRETVLAYFAADGNVSSAAQKIGVKRQTVTNRLRMIEDRLQRPLSTCRAELETALRMEEL